MAWKFTVSDKCSSYFSNSWNSPFNLQAVWPILNKKMIGRLVDMRQWRGGGGGGYIGYI